MTQMLAEPTTSSSPDITHVMTCGDPNRALCGYDITDLPVTNNTTDRECNICVDLDYLLDCTCKPGCPCCDNT